MRMRDQQAAGFADERKRLKQRIKELQYENAKQKAERWLDTRIDEILNPKGGES